MLTKIALGEIAVEVVKKDIKNLHLSVYPPAGRVRISAPLRMNLDTIRVFAISKLSWIKRQQKKLREQERETPREYLDRESHYVWGKRYLLKWSKPMRHPPWNSSTTRCTCRSVRVRAKKRSRPFSKNGIASSSRRQFPP